MTIAYTNNNVKPTLPVERTALELIARGYCVVAVNGKRPVAKWEPLTTPTPPTHLVEAHLAALRDGRADRIGLVTGIQNLVCLDIDARSPDTPVDDLAVDDILIRLERPFVENDIWTWRSSSGAGWHIWMTVPDLPADATRLVVPSTDPSVRHIEVRARGHYTVIPPTVDVPTTPPPSATWATVLRAVRYTPPAPPAAPTSASAPAAEPARLAAPREIPDADVLAAWIERVAQATEGTRNDTLVRAAFVAGRFIAAGLVDRDAVERDLLNATTLPHKEAIATIRSGLEAGMEKPWEPAATARRRRHHPQRYRVLPMADRRPHAGQDGGQAGGQAGGHGAGQVTGTDGQEAGQETGQSAADVLLEAIALLEYRFYHNVETDQTMFTSPTVSSPTLLTDRDVAELRWNLRAMNVRGIGALSDAIAHLASTNRVAPVRDALMALTWDGRPHIRHLASFLQVEEGLRPGLSEDWLTIWLLGAVRRVFDHTHNIVLVLEGAQGIGKSVFVRWLASLDRSLYIEQVIDPQSKDSRLALTRHLVWEISEIDAVTNRHDAAALKQFISTEIVEERAAYARYPTRLPALASFIATTNAMTGYLTDATGNRRFLPLPLKRIDWTYAGTVDVRQIWAEAKARYLAGELDPLLGAVAQERLQLTEARRVRTLVDDWIDTYFVITNNPDDALTSAEIVKELATRGCNFGGTERSAAMAIATALTARGLRKKRVTVGSVRTVRWVGIAVR